MCCVVYDKISVAIEVAITTKLRQNFGYTTEFVGSYYNYVLFTTKFR